MLHLPARPLPALSTCREEAVTHRLRKQNNTLSATLYKDRIYLSSTWLRDISYFLCAPKHAPATLSYPLRRANCDKKVKKL